MGWFKPQYWSWILVSAAVCVSCQTLTSTLREGNRACPGEVVDFTCVGQSTSSSFVLAWTSTEYIGQGDLLQFSTTDMRGETTTSTINSNVVATLVNSTNDNGVLMLESVLRIVADQASMVMCVTSGGTASIEFSISAVPGLPQVIRATEISRLTDDTCIILVQWSPPANSSGSDISQYMLYVRSRNIRDTVPSTISVLSVPNCPDDLRVRVAAVNRFGCEGSNVEVRASLLDILTVPTENRTTESEDRITEGGSISTSNQLGVGAAVGITIAVIVLCSSHTLVILFYLYGFYRNRKVYCDHDHEGQLIEFHTGNQGDYQGSLQDALKDLYVHLSTFSLQGENKPVRDLHTKLKVTPVQIVQDALVLFLDNLKWEESENMQRALDTLKGIPGIDGMVKSNVEELRDATVSTSKDGNALDNFKLIKTMDDIIVKVEKAAPDTLKKVLLGLCDTMLKMPGLSDAQKNVLSKFELSLESLKMIEKSLTAEFVKGLKREGQDVKVKMLITHVHSVPSRKEEFQSNCLVVDLGVSYLHMLLVLTDKGETEHHSQKFLIDHKTKQLSQTVLFDFIAKCVEEFLEDKKTGEKLRVVVVFSFPVKQESLKSGKLIRWTKGYNVDGAVGKDVVQLLQDAFDRKAMKVDVVALINDTTGTQLSVPNCSVGLILGTSVNACYMESVNAVPKFKGYRQRYSRVIIDTEWGAFGEDGKLDTYRTPYDRQLDKEYSTGEQIFEKMISGKYLGEIARLALKDLIIEKELFEGCSSPKFDAVEAFDIRRLSVIEKGDNDDCKTLFKNHFSIDVSVEDCEVVRRVCEAVSTRAARLAAVGIIALVKKIKKINGCNVAVDGSVYRRHPYFADRMRIAMDELAPGNKIRMKLTETYGSARGAAFMAYSLPAAENPKSPRSERSVIPKGQKKSRPEGDGTELKEL